MNPTDPDYLCPRKYRDESRTTKAKQGKKCSSSLFSEIPNIKGVTPTTVLLENYLSPLRINNNNNNNNDDDDVRITSGNGSDANQTGDDHCTVTLCRTNVDRRRDHHHLHRLRDAGCRGLRVGPQLSFQPPYAGQQHQPVPFRLGGGRLQ